MVTDIRKLVEGEHVSTWATMKLCRAVQHFNDFSTRVNQWNASRVYRAPLRISDDREFVEFLQPVGTRPPVDEWGLHFGDAIHNIRAALDCVVWEFAHLDGGQPEKPNQVMFPVIGKRSEWRAAATRLKTVPGDLLGRIEAVQPFNSPDSSPEANWLSIISRLDNDDKHRGVIVGLPLLDHVLMEGMSIKLGESLPGMEGQFATHFNLDNLADGEPFARFSFGARIESGSVLPPHAVIGMGASVRYRDDLIPVAALAQDGLAFVHRVIDFLRSGSFPEDDVIIEPERFESNLSV
jgi:hypothetical protein